MGNAWISLTRGTRRDSLGGSGVHRDGTLEIMVGSGWSGRVLKEMTGRGCCFLRSGKILMQGKLPLTYKDDPI